MLRLTAVSQTCEETVLNVEGWVAEADAELLEEELSRQLQTTGRLVLDLKGVKSIDRTGLGLLQRWIDRGVVLRDGSAFIRALLERKGLLQAGIRSDLSQQGGDIP